MNLAATRQKIYRRNVTPKASSLALHELVTRCERTRTRFAVRWLSRKVRYRSRVLPAGRRRHKRNAVGIASALIPVLSLYDGVTKDHIQRTRVLAEKVASELGLDPGTMRTTSHATALHDIGKICIPSRILNKPGRLDEDEWRVMRRHSEIGTGILSRIGVPERVSSAVLAHHERFDGRGYPASLSGEAIPIEARIISVVDAYDAMTNDRPYRKALGHREAVEQLNLHSGSQFDPAVVKAMNAVLNKVRF